ncbi:polysaccharide deacetylase family protein [Kitasatospora aureofaciens]|uniref:polysaccharide deacetylase family protein n=1 Tax=Kitasatospora aureofaciens TaxID=1894 RepID=UPI0005274FAF|nr:polysaccharide deacetylase family protein [Kitasatospora aureofaciens]HJD82880.1 polysaccharide deacetylase family protein [Kitasatospora aureofaciens]
MAVRPVGRRGVGRVRTTIGALAVALVAGAVVAVPTGTAEAAGAAGAGMTGSGGGSGKVVYLTFDDGPSPTYTPRILSILNRYGVHATFFEIGENVAAHPSLTAQVARQGHSVQNHSWSHPDLRRLSGPSFNSQVGNTDQAIRAQTGRTPKCLRPPYGAVNGTVRSRAAALGKQIVLWSVDPADWSRPGTGAIQSRVLRNVRPGSVILMHDGGGDRSQTAAALPTILSTLKARGYSFAPLC